MNGDVKKSALRAQCPVPVDQIPIKEYEGMSESWFYSWGARSVRGYLVPIISLWLLSWLAVGPMAAVSFGPAKFFPQFALSAGLGALLLPALALTQLYIGWRHVSDRLLRRSVFYEESGWYDGQMWEKPEDVFNRDRLIADYQVQPILQRLQKTFAILFGLVALSLVSWQFV